jgi:hypothetical protein
VDDKLGQVRNDVLRRAWLYRDPESFREGVLAAVEALSSADARTDEDMGRSLIDRRVIRG